jgi:hypothetical protein
MSTVSTSIDPVSSTSSFALQRLGPVIVCPEGYWKRGNVQIACKKYGIEMVNDDDGLRDI